MTRHDHTGHDHIGCACHSGASSPGLVGARPLRRRDFLRYAGAATAAVTLAPLSSCIRAARQAGGADKQVIVLAFDGMDWDLVQRLMGEGRMPNFRRLASQGHAQPLGTSIPPLSPVAWSNFTTGLDAGGHGIFDFVHRDPATMRTFSSTSRTDDPGGFTVAGWHIPLGGGQVELLRHGQAFWEVLRDNGVPTTVLRMPANFPPTGTADREVSGMGTPDLLGTDGAYSFYSSEQGFRRRTTGSGGRHYPFPVSEGAARAQLHGPPNPFREEEAALTVPLEMVADPVEPVAFLRAGGEERVLQVGEWSDWVPITFNMIPTQALAGQVRFYLRSVRPHIELYVSPINADPLAPGIPIDSPGGYAAELAEATGRFYTKGMPEDTQATNDGILGLDEFLAQSTIVREEMEAQYHHVLGQFDSGFLFYYFSFTDLVAHIMWKSIDPDHPAYDPEVDAQYEDVVPTLYERADFLVGKALERLPEDGTLLVMSDHGFSPLRRNFALNTWLQEEGYLVLREERTEGRLPTIFRDVDWQRTRAYGVGINGLYVNVAGRERLGIVAPSDREWLLGEIASKLEQVEDPDTGLRVVSKVFAADESVHQGPFADIAPDAVMGYAKTYRSSGPTSVGQIQREVLTDNTQAWSGDHSMDPAVVPGILFSSRRLRREVRSLQDLAAAVLAEFGIERFPVQDGSTGRGGA